MTATAGGARVEPDGVLASRLEGIRGRIADAASLAARNPDDITLVVVSKFHTAQLVRQLAALGVEHFGENRHQEAQSKAAELADLDVRWHFVGQLQSNKAKAVVEYASAIHSVDRGSLVTALSAAAPDPVDCFIQLNLTDDANRGGVGESGLEALVERVLDAQGLRLLGIMAVAPLDEEPRRAFARVRSASQRVQSIAPHADRISAGMSHDFEAAIHEGATHLRIGSAITGNRPGPG